MSVSEGFPATPARRKESGRRVWPLSKPYWLLHSLQSGCRLGVPQEFMTPIVYAPPESRRDRMSPTLCLLVVASLVCVPWQSAKSQQTHGSPSSPTPVKVADAVCAKCHQQIYEDY